MADVSTVSSAPAQPLLSRPTSSPPPTPVKPADQYAPGTQPDAHADQQQQLQAVRHLLRDNGGDLQALPPRLQHAYYVSLKQQNPQHYDSVRHQAVGTAQNSDNSDHRSLGQMASDGLATTWDLKKKALCEDEVEKSQRVTQQLQEKKTARFEHKLAQNDPSRFKHYQAVQHHDQAEVAADTGSDGIRRRDFESRQHAQQHGLGLDRRLDALKQQNPQRYRQIVDRSTADDRQIYQTTASDFSDQQAVKSNLQHQETAQLQRNSQAWLATLPAAQRVRQQARLRHDNAVALDSGLAQAQSLNTMGDTLTFGAYSATKEDGVAGGVADLVTMGGYTASKNAGIDLGLAHEERLQAGQLRRMGNLKEAGDQDDSAVRHEVSGAVNGGMAALSAWGAADLAKGVVRAGIEKVAARDVAGTEAANGLRMSLPEATALDLDPGDVIKNSALDASRARGSSASWEHNYTLLPSKHGDMNYETCMALSHEVKFFGATPDEEALVKDAITHLPQKTQEQLMPMLREVHVVDMPALDRVAGFADSPNGVIVLNRQVVPGNLLSTTQFQKTTIHEASHVLDFGKGKASQYMSEGLLGEEGQPAIQRFGVGPYATEYAKTSAIEDAADTSMELYQMRRLVHAKKMGDAEFYVLAKEHPTLGTKYRDTLEWLQECDTDKLVEQYEACTLTPKQIYDQLGATTSALSHQFSLGFH